MSSAKRTNTTSPCAHFVRQTFTTRSENTQEEVPEKRRNHRTLRTHCLCVRPLAFLDHPSVEPVLDQSQDARVGDAMLREPDQPTLVEIVGVAQQKILCTMPHIV